MDERFDEAKLDQVLASIKATVLTQCALDSASASVMRFPPDMPSAVVREQLEDLLVDALASVSTLMALGASLTPEEFKAALSVSLGREH